MLFTNVMKTLILIALFVAVPVMVINFSKRGISKLIEYLRAGPHRP